MANENAVPGRERLGADIVAPCKLAHFVLRTSRFDEVLDFYRIVLSARIIFNNGALAFLSYDDEHHRVAILQVPGLEEQPSGIAGVHHIAFTFSSLTILLENYASLKCRNILPVYVINHGPTTSLYYQDPDGNQLEFQVENFGTVERSTEFFYSDAFAENPIGVEFDPDDMLIRLRAGVPEDQLKQRPDAGPKGLEDVKLR